MTENTITKERVMSLGYDKAELYSQVDGLSLQNLFYVKNGYFPNCYMFTSPAKSVGSHFKTSSFLEDMRKKCSPDDMVTVVYNTYNIETKEDRLGVSFIFPEKNIYARIEDQISECYVLYGPNDKEALKWFIDSLMGYYVKDENTEGNIYLLSQSSAGFGLSKWEINDVKDYDISKQYNDDFVREDKVITDFMKDNEKSGLIILHGEKGTGKSTYIRHLVNEFKEKKFVFIHSGLISLLGEPSFNNFLISLSDSVIILEDCEDALKSRKSMGSTAAVGILLNMTDGLLADNLKIKFICTFNEDISNIDSALLRKGRLVCKYEFKKLGKEKSNALLNELYPDDASAYTEKSMSLADIYNWKDEAYECNRKKII